MKKVFLIAFVLYGVLAYSRNCPSQLNANLHDLGDNLSYGAELRGFYFGVDEGDFTSNYYAGFRPMAIWYAGNLTTTMEIDLRYKFGEKWDKKGSKSFKFRLNQLSLEYDSSPFYLYGGIMFFNFSSGAILDQRFAGAGIDYKGKGFKFGIIGGITRRSMMRSTYNCLWKKYIDTGWKYISNDMENRMFGIKASIKTLKPYRMQFLFLYSAPSIDMLKSLSFSIAMGGPIIKGKLSFLADAIAIIDNEDNIIPIVLGKANYSITSKARLTVGGFSSFNTTATPSPVYESLSIGLIKRYSIHSRNVAISELELKIGKIKAFFNYYIQGEKIGKGIDSDELDIGTYINLKERYSLKVAYVGMDMLSKNNQINSAYIEARIIF